LLGVNETKSISTSSSAIADRPRCRVGHLWPKVEDDILQTIRGVYTRGGMVRDAPWRKLGGEKFCDDNDVFARVYNNLLLHEYCTFITLHECTFNLLFAFFLHCVSKKHPQCFSYNSRKHCQIFTIFGRNISEKVGNQKMLYFSTSPN